VATRAERHAERVLIWGGGGHGKGVGDLVRAMGAGVAGVADSMPGKLGAVVEPGGGQVVLSEDDLCRVLQTGAILPGEATAIALGIGDNGARLERARCVLSGGSAASLPAWLHPRAMISPSVTTGSGTVVFAGAVINAATRLGIAVIINSGAIVEHDCMVGDGTHVAPGATLTGGVRVGQTCLIGARAVVLPGVSVGDGAVVGAGAVVNRDVPSGACVTGIPARGIMGTRST
jgi:sugar O-acyltransferase (sialic acid O-acetyltransferase NeuD family)